MKLQDVNNIIHTSEFKRWFANSVVVDPQGNPLRVYHGTKNDFKAFTNRPFGVKTDWAIFFTPDTSHAEFWGGIVYPVYLSIKNPYTPGTTAELIQPDVDLLRSKGYDGVIGDYPAGPAFTGGGHELVKYYAVFDPNQIKSAIGNRGTYSSDSNDITEGLDLLNEKRRGDPKESAYQQLKAYKDDHDIYISFTEVDKIGINPKSGYSTPIGIYTYPLSTVWNDFNHDRHEIVVPWASYQPYIYVIKSHNVFDIQTYTESDLNTDTAKVRQLTMHDLRNASEINQTIDSATSDAKNSHPFTIIWNITRKLAELYDGKPQVKWNYLLRRLGYSKIVDHGAGLIHPQEPTQAVFLSKNTFKTVDKIINNPEVLNKTTDEVKSLRSSAKNALTYILSRLETGNTLPDNIKRLEYVISKDDRVSRDYALALVERDIKVPTMIEETIALDGHSSSVYGYALASRKKKIPDAISRAVTEDEYTNYNHVVHLTKNGYDVPQVNMDCLNSNPHYNYHYAKTLYTNGIPVPDTILKVMCKEPDYCLRYAELLSTLNDPIPPIISQVLRDNNMLRANFRYE